LGGARERSLPFEAEAVLLLTEVVNGLVKNTPDDVSRLHVLQNIAGI